MSDLYDIEEKIALLETWKNSPIPARKALAEDNLPTLYDLRRIEIMDRVHARKIQRHKREERQYRED